MCYVSDGKSCSGQLKIKRTHCKYKYKYSIKCIHRNLHNAKPACQPLPLLQLLTKSIIPYDTLWVWGQELYGHWKVWIFGGERIPLELLLLLLLLLHTIAMCTGLQSTHCFLLWATTLHHYWVVLKPKYSCPPCDTLAYVPKDVAKRWPQGTGNPHPRLSIPKKGGRIWPPLSDIFFLGSHDITRYF